MFVGSEPRISVGLPAQLASCRASSCSAAQHNAYASLDFDDEHAARRYNPIIVLWTSLAILLWCTQRASIKVQVAAFLVAEAAYIWLHVKPLTAILAAVPAQPDISFLRCYTTGTYFASELALFWMVAFASPIWAVVPRAVLAIHAAFHVLYTVLATFARRWCLQQNIERLQAPRSGTSWQSLWAATLNLLNGADAALHVWYFILLAAAF